MTLKAGQEMWGNRWGEVTGIRYYRGQGWQRPEMIAGELLAKLPPEKLGMSFVALREQALAARPAVPIP